MLTQRIFHFTIIQRIRLAVKFAAQNTQKISILSFYENSKQKVKNQNTDF